MSNILSEIEPLEPRQLLSAVLTANGTLQVYGTAKSDVIDVTVNANESVAVSVNGTADVSSPFTEVKRIKIHGRAGSDQITLDESNAATLLAATIAGGTGSDTITAGNEDNFISGGDGRDEIAAGNGNNVVHGGTKADHITVGNGDNIVLALGRNNVVVAGTGNDTIVAGNHTDISGGGDDLLWGKSGHDTITGNVNGLTGSDTIYTDAFKSTDTIQAGPDDVVDPSGKNHPASAVAYLLYLESLRQVPVI